jgi:hypothetical protein
MCHTGGRRPARVRCDRGTAVDPQIFAAGRLASGTPGALGLSVVDARSGPPLGGLGAGR